jgi:hypothetical protein
LILALPDAAVEQKQRFLNMLYDISWFVIAVIDTFYFNIEFFNSRRSRKVLLRAADCVRTGAAISECGRPWPQQRSDDRPITLCHIAVAVNISAPGDGRAPKRWRVGGVAWIYGRRGVCDRAGLQPLGIFVVRVPVALPQAGILRAVGAGAMRKV